MKNMSNTNDLVLSEDQGTYNIKSNITKQEIIQLATQLIDTLFATGDTICSPQETRKYIKVQLGHLEHEVFAVLFLDNQHHVIAFEKMFIGTIDSATVYPREVIKKALAFNSSALVICHNHPSGIAEPSQADIRITQRIKDACSLVEIRLLDHIIVGSGSPVSMAERGII